MSRHVFYVATLGTCRLGKTRSRHHFMSRQGFGVARGLVSRPRFEVTTWSVLSGVATSIGCRDMIQAALMLRHRSEVATWGQAAWACRDKCMPSMRATCVGCARDLRWLCARQACCARSSAHDMGTARAVCARPGSWVCALCTQASFVTVHCLGSLFRHCSWTLFKNSVHR